MLRGRERESQVSTVSRFSVKGFLHLHNADGVVENGTSVLWSRLEKEGRIRQEIGGRERERESAGERVWEREKGTEREGVE